MGADIFFVSLMNKYRWSHCCVYRKCNFSSILLLLQVPLVYAVNSILLNYQLCPRVGNSSQIKIMKSLVFQSLLLQRAPRRRRKCFYYCIVHIFLGGRVNFIISHFHSLFFNVLQSPYSSSSRVTRRQFCLMVKGRLLFSN